ncbi:MAG: acetyl-CoA carboxylase biotin carboxyl carrier protein subunit [Bacteroidota bacterium]
MGKAFKAVVNGNMDYMVDEDEIINLDAIKTSPKTYHILKENKSFHAEIVHTDFNQKKYTIKINNTSYAIDISNELDLLIAEMGFSIGSSKRVNLVEAPMPGLILDIHIAAKQEVKTGDILLVLEAMKMENSITSPRDGIIKSISVAVGDTVEKKQLLIAFE